MGVVRAAVCCCCSSSSSSRDGLWQDGLVVALRGLLGRCLAGAVVRRLVGRTGWW